MYVGLFCLLCLVVLLVCFCDFVSIVLFYLDSVTVTKNIISISLALRHPSSPDTPLLPSAVKDSEDRPAAAHVYGEGDVWVALDAAGVTYLIPYSRHARAVQ